MRIFALIGAALRSLGRCLGLIGSTANQSLDVSVRKARGPAVAGFVMRAHVDRFGLARRLASVAKLNVPFGRKPRSATSAKSDHPPVPVTRLGAKKVRINADAGRRVLQALAQKKPMRNNVIPFQKRTRIEWAGRDITRKAA